MWKVPWFPDSPSCYEQREGRLLGFREFPSRVSQMAVQANKGNAMFFDFSPGADKQAVSILQASAPRIGYKHRPIATPFPPKKMQMAFV